MRIATICFLFVISTGTLNASILMKGVSEGMPYQLELLAEGLSIPWGMTLISSSELLITERSGSLKLLDLQSGRMSDISGLPAIFAKGQGGLLDIAASPDYSASHWIYFTYSKPIDGGGATTLARAKLANLKLYHWQDLLITRPASDSAQHFGSRITFDQAGYVYFGVGDRGERENSQNLSNHAGTLLRLNLDGSIPVNNPFYTHGTALPEIWSYGHRNPQGLFYDKTRKVLWEIEHGPRGGDEINIIQPGLNYGWPIISYGKEYWGPFQVGESTEKEGMEQPFKYYIPSIAPSSLLVYQGDAFPKWRGDLFAGALVLTHLNRIQLTSNGESMKEAKEERLLVELGERIRNVIESKEGWLYISVDSGKILKLVPLIN